MMLTTALASRVPGCSRGEVSSALLLSRTKTDQLYMGSLRRFGTEENENPKQKAHQFSLAGFRIYYI